ncbi:PREDICTED: uncharacterized protein LOC108561364 [Nicrophorus vespilloides]|uniref:Uncharacterized protein LOC108561364 n=1 Tax=Nicrophorus vespilloides TaxID=110193 RepID=A0ABM1MJK0_NICVS|nr:PREDICTED: uncharacterized protein LOC108561364 [Nicrophorus vespilloides]
MDITDIPGVTDTNANASRTSGKPDTLNSEFLYYSSVLKILAATLTNELDKQKIVPWAKKLFRPEYHSSQFREKRNKYLLHLTLTILNDEAYGIFTQIPPAGALLDLESIEKEQFPAAEWELDTTWQDTKRNLSEEFEPLQCSVHSTLDECNSDHLLDKILDQEFQFLLYLVKPYAALLPNSYDRTRVATWMQTLCSIADESCSSMRGIRNDYIMALLGYVHNLRLVGPFSQYPPIRALPPLAEAAKMAAETKPITDPNGPDAAEFLASQPVPDDGAFCYIALTGDLITSNLPPPSGPAGPPDDY